MDRYGSQIRKGIREGLTSSAQEKRGEWIESVHFPFLFQLSHTPS